MRAVVYLTHTLIKTTPTSPIKIMLDKHTAALNHIVPIFKIYVPPQSTPPTTTVPPQEDYRLSTPKVNTPYATPEAITAPPLRMNTPGDISIKSSPDPNPLPQQTPHVIPYDTYSMPPALHRNTRVNPHVPTVYIYNTR